MSECSYHNNIFFSLISKKNKNERFSIIGRFIALVGDCDSTVENLEDAKLLRHFWKDPGPFRHSVRHSLSRSFCSLCLTIQYRSGSTFILSVYSLNNEAFNKVYCFQSRQETINLALKFSLFVTVILSVRKTRPSENY